MPIYYGHNAIVSVRTDTVGFHELPYGVRIATGITAPAAAAGAKTFSGIARCKSSSVGTVGLILNLAAVLRAKTTAVADVHTPTVDLAGALRCRTTTPRCELSAGVASSITFVAAGTAVTGNNAATLACTAPTHAVGDLLMAVAISYGTGTFAAPTSGWNVTDSTTTTGQHVEAFWRFADGSSLDNYTFSYSGGAAGDTQIATIYAYRNVNPTTPFCPQYQGSLTSLSLQTDYGNFGPPRVTIGGVNNTVSQNYYTAIVTNARIVAYVCLKDDNTLATPTITNLVVASPNTNSADETAFFPISAPDFSVATTLGNDATQLGFSKNYTGAATNFSAAANVNYTAPNVGFSIFAKSGALNPIATFNVAVWLDGTIRAKSTLSGDLTIPLSSKLLDGALRAKATLTGDLDRRPGVFCAGLLACKVTMDPDFFIAGRITAKLRVRSVGNLAVLTTGTTHHPTALLQSKASLNGQLTINYMRALLACKVRTFCDLYVNVKLAGSMQAKSTATLNLLNKRAFAGTAACKSTATARLFTPLRGIAASKVTTQLALAVSRRFIGTAACKTTATTSLYVGRYFAALLQARSTATVVPYVSREFAARLPMRATAAMALSIDHRLAALLAMRCSAFMDMDIAYAPHAPTAEVTVTPDMVAIEEITSGAVIDSGFNEAQVE